MGRSKSMAKYTRTLSGPPQRRPTVVTSPAIDEGPVRCTRGLIIVVVPTKPPRLRSIEVVREESAGVMRYIETRSVQVFSTHMR